MSSVGADLRGPCSGGSDRKGCGPPRKESHYHMDLKGRDLITGLLEGNLYLMCI